MKDMNAACHIKALEEALLRWLELSALAGPQGTYHYGSFFKNELWSWNAFKVTLDAFITSTIKLQRTFPSQSLMHLCHLVNKTKLKCFCEGGQILASSEMLAGGLWGVLWWLDRLLLLSITDGLLVSNHRRTANGCDLVNQSHEKLFCVTGKRKVTTTTQISGSHCYPVMVL